MHESWGILDGTGRKWGYISHSGKWLVKPRYGAAGEFSGGRAPVFMKESEWGFIDKSGALVIPFQFREATPFAKGLAHVRVKEP